MKPARSSAADEYKEETGKKGHQVNNQIFSPSPIQSIPIEKKSLLGMNVICQWEDKFILAVPADVKNCLLVFDQHAVHERIRLESICHLYYKSLLPSKQVVIELSEEDVALYCDSISRAKRQGIYNPIIIQQACACGFTWISESSIRYETGSSRTLTLSCPVFLLQDPFNLSTSYIERIFQDILHQRHAWMNLPYSLMEYFKLEACHSKNTISRYILQYNDISSSSSSLISHVLDAIKFGQSLSRQICHELLNELSKCSFPFICAHGRCLVQNILF